MHSLMLMISSITSRDWARKSQAKHDVLKATGYVTLVTAGTHYSLRALASASASAVEE